VSDHAEGIGHRQLLVELATQARLPTMFSYRVFVEVGGFMAYAADQGELSRQAADYFDRLLRGANPGELPFQQPTKFELVINLKTAKALGLTIPPSMLARADEIIQ
jgi:putative ABC transport system substrate-binding protein